MLQVKVGHQVINLLYKQQLYKLGGKSLNGIFANVNICAHFPKKKKKSYNNEIKLEKPFPKSSLADCFYRNLLEENSVIGFILEYFNDHDLLKQFERTLQLPGMTL